MSTRIVAIAVDARDAEVLAEFWAAALGVQEIVRWRDGHGLGYVELRPPQGPAVLFQPVPEKKSMKNRLHLDIRPAQRGQYEEIDRLLALGATVVTDDPAERFVVLADVEGNEFCVLPHTTGGAA